MEQITFDFGDEPLVAEDKVLVSKEVVTLVIAALDEAIGLSDSLEGEGYSGFSDINNVYGLIEALRNSLEEND